MKFLVDAQLPPALAAWLRTKECEAETVQDVGLLEASDESIWSYALGVGAIIVTKDEDFAFLAATRAGPRILWVRVVNVANRALLRRFEVAWPQILSHLNEGAPVIELR